MSASDFPELQRQFSLRGELIHCFVSYRVNTEGPKSNGLSGLIANKIRALSLDAQHGVDIPRHGWYVFPALSSHARVLCARL